MHTKIFWSQTLKKKNLFLVYELKSTSYCRHPSHCHHQLVYSQSPGNLKKWISKALIPGVVLKLARIAGKQQKENGTKSVILLEEKFWMTIFPQVVITFKPLSHYSYIILPPFCQIDFWRNKISFSYFYNDIHYHVLLLCCLL